MYASFKNAPFSLNGSGYLVNDLKISIDASLEPLLYNQERAATFYNATDSIGGSISFTYFLSGRDYLKDFTVNERSPISGNFGGLYFNSGYLRSYNLNCSPNNPVIVSAEIVHFDAWSGIYTKSYDRSTGTKILNYCDALLVDVSRDSAGGGIGNISGISNIQYSFNSEIDPLYFAGDQMPSQIRFGRKEMVAVLTTDIYSGDLPITGKPAGIKVNFTHPELPGIVENFSVSGVLFKREMDVSDGGFLRSKLYVRQSFAEKLPGITSISDTSAAPGDTITIEGENLETSMFVAFEGQPASFTIVSPTSLSVVVPNNVVSGDITVTTQGGTIRKGLFAPTYPALTVNKISPISGAVSGYVFISGSNFYQVTDVRFSTTAPGLWTGSSGFKTLDSTMIYAPVPVNAAWGPVLVMATGRGVSGQSVEKFVPIPTIYSFYPQSGMSGDAINISGVGFSGITGVLFNNLPSISPYTASFAVTANTGIRVTIPTGNVRGPIKLLAQSGISVNTNTNFSPFVSLTGIVPLSGRTGTAITLLGHNMFPDIMYSLGNNSYAVTFQNDVTGVFFRTQFVNPNFTGLTGLIPYNAKSGIIGINYDAGSTYSSTVTFKLINEPPTITGVSPKSGTYSGYIDILGTNFYDVSAVKLSGLGVITTISSPASVTNTFADIVSFRIPVLTPKLTGDLYTVIVETTIGANATGNGLLTILDAPIFSGFTGRLLGTSGAYGDRILVTGKNIYPNSQIFIPYTGLSGESGQAFIDSGSFNSTNSQVAFYVPLSARTGLSNIILYNGVDYASGADFKLINKPSISGIFPFSSGQWGDTLSISGAFLSNTTSVRIGTGLNASFSIITDTGITFTVPEDSPSDVVIISGLAGSSISTGVLSILPPLHTITSFSPTRGYTGDNISIIGTRLQTVDAILFTGGANQVLFDYRYFTKIGTTQITMPVPGGITSGEISLRSPRGLVTSSQFFEPFLLPSISSISSLYGAHLETISVAGSNLSGMFLWFCSPNSGKYVSGLNQSMVGGTGVTVTIPREITVGPIMVSGSGRIWASTSDIFVPLPTISGFSPTTVQSGNSVTITGINATRVLDMLLMTGNHKFWNAVSGVFTRNLINASGSHIVDQTTGFSIFTVPLDSEIISTGRIFLINSYFSGSITGTETFLTSAISGKIGNILSTQTLTISETAPIL